MVVLLVSATPALQAQTGPIKSLYVATCSDNKKCKKQQVHRFRFQKGVLISRDIVLETRPTSDRFLLMTASLVIDNRYLISVTGAVVDTQTGTLYAKETGDRANYDSGKVYIEQRINFEKRLRTVVLNLATGKYDLYRDPNFFSGNGVSSPDHRRRIVYDQFVDRFLMLEREGSEPSRYSTKWGFGEFSVTCDWCSLDKAPPAVWIDNDRFITQRSNGVLVIYDFQTKDWTDLVTISVPKTLYPKPKLEKDAQGNFFYETDKLYGLDIENKRYAEVPFITLPFGFRRTSGIRSKLFRFNERDLGEFISSRWITTDGYLAIEYQDPPYARWEPIGIKVWGTAANSWTTIKLDYTPIVLGWINES